MDTFRGEKVDQKLDKNMFLGMKRFFGLPTLHFMTAYVAPGLDCFSALVRVSSDGDPGHE